MRADNQKVDTAPRSRGENDMIGIGKSWITPDMMIANFKDMLCQMQQEIMTRFKMGNLEE